MNQEQLKAFLSGTHLMDIATLHPSGYPHVTPVWYEYDGEFFWANTAWGRVKAKNIQKNPRVGFSIAPPALPYGAVVGYGDALLIDDPDGKHIEKLAFRYLPADKAAEYAKSLKQSRRVTIKIKPVWLNSWQG